MNSMNEHQTFAEFLEEYKEQEQKVQTLDFDNLSEEDRQLLHDFAEKKAFLNETANSLAFAQNSTAFVVVLDPEKDFERSFVLETMTSKEEYVAEMITLTNGLDKETMQALMRQRGLNDYEIKELTAQVDTVLDTAEMQREVERQMRERQQQEITLQEIREMNERIEEEKRQLRIQEQEQNEPDKTAERFAELAGALALTVITVEVAEELSKTAEKLQEREKPVISVDVGISDDGHAVIKDIAGQNPKGKDVDAAEVAAEVRQKVAQATQNVEETVSLHSRTVAPLSEKAKEERKIEHATKKPKPVER